MKKEKRGKRLDLSRSKKGSNDPGAFYGNRTALIGEKMVAFFQVRPPGEKVS